MGAVFYHGNAKVFGVDDDAASVSTFKVLFAGNSPQFNRRREFPATFSLPRLPPHLDSPAPAYFHDAHAIRNDSD